ncbi:MAG: hypothetical protein R3F43_17180 [bacterium]
MANNLHQELVRVPLVIKMPGFPAGARVTSVPTASTSCPPCSRSSAARPPRTGRA